MDILLFTNYSENNRMNKILSAPVTLSGVLRQSTDIIDPVINIEYDDPTEYNYVYIEDFGRYYFITGCSVIRTGLWQLNLHVDVLGSYKSQILAKTALISKQQNAARGNVYFNDGSEVNDSRCFNTIINFSDGFNASGEFILITAGG